MMMPLRPRQLRRLLALALFGAILAGTGIGYGISDALVAVQPGVGSAAGIQVRGV